MNKTEVPFGAELAWEIKDYVFRQFFNYIRNRLREIENAEEYRKLESKKQRGTYLKKKFDELYDEIRDEWRKFESAVGKSSRMKGFLYQILFWLANVRSEIIEKESGEPLRDIIIPKMTFMVPIYETVPSQWRMGDFVATSRRLSRPIIIDVKSSSMSEKEFRKRSEEYKNRGYEFCVVWPRDKDGRLSTLTNQHWASRKSWEGKT